MKKTGVIVTGVICVGLAAALAVSVFLRLTKTEETIEEIPVTSVSVQKPQTGSIELKTGLTGTVEPADTVYVIPKLSGEVLEVYVSMGDTVTKGQKLFRLDNTQLDAAKIALDQAQLSVNDAQTSLNRMKVLYESGDISSQSYEQVVTAFNQAKLQYDSAKLNYDTQAEYTTVTAPIGGLLEEFDVEVHDMVGGSSVGVIAGDGSRSVSFSVSERVAQGLAVGDVLTVEKNGSTYDGAITEIGTMVDSSTGLFKVKASLTGAEALANGSMVKLYVTDRKADNVMTLPVDCVSYSGGDAFVYVYQDDGTVKQTPIEQGLIDSEKVQVASGLDWNDEVVVTWSKELYDGAEVQIVEAANAGETGAAAEAEGTAGQEAEDGSAGEAVTEETIAEDGSAGEAVTEETAAEETAAE